MKYRIALDCDDVLNNLNEKTTEMFNKENHSNLTSENFSSFDIYKCLPFEDAEKYCALWDREELWNSLNPVHHSQWGVKKLVDNGFDVYITTATNLNHFQWKLRWLKKYFSFIDDSRIICIKDKSILNVDVMIDDNASNLIDNIRCNRVILNKPWNLSVRDEVYGIKRCNDWEEIVSAVNEFYKKDEEMMSR